MQCTESDMFNVHFAKHQTTVQLVCIFRNLSFCSVSKLLSVAICRMNLWRSGTAVLDKLDLKTRSCFKIDICYTGLQIFVTQIFVTQACNKYQHCCRVMYSVELKYSAILQQYTATADLFSAVICKKVIKQ